MKVRRIARLMSLIVGVMAIAAFICEGSAAWPWGKKTENPDGKISIQASTTLRPIVQPVAEEYKALNPEMDITIEEGSSEDAIAALLDGRVNIAVSDREMEFGETEEAKTKGVEPFLTEMKIADKELFVYTNGEPKEAIKNFIDFLSIVEVEAPEE